MLTIREVDIDKITPSIKNPRRISRKGLDKIKASIRDFGWTNPILVRKGTMKIIAGHQRYTAALELGFKKVPVIELDMTEAEAIAYNIADNRVGEESTWDFDQLSAKLQEMVSGGIDIENAGFDHKELDYLLRSVAEPLSTPQHDVVGAEDVPVSEEEAAPVYDYRQYEVVPLIFSLNQEQKAIVKQAVDIVKSSQGIKERGPAIAVICRWFKGVAA